MSLGDRIRHARKALGMTQKQLAGDDFSAAFISQVERNVITPSLASLRIIAARLGQPVSHFLEADTGDRQNEIDLLINLGKVYLTRNALAEAEANLAKAERIAGEIGDLHRQAIAIRNLGAVAFYNGQQEQAVQHFQAALELLSNEEVYQEIAAGHFSLASAYHHSGHLKLAIEHYLASLSALEQEGSSDTTFRVRILGNLGNAFCRLGDLEQGITYHEEALRLASEVSDFVHMGQNYMGLGLVYRDRGQLDKALECSQKGLEIFESLDNFKFIATLRVNIGVILADQGAWDDAYGHFLEAARLNQRISNPRGEAYARYELARYHLHRGEYSTALDCCQRSLELLEPLEDHLELARGQRLIGDACRAQGKLPRALEQYQLAAGLLQKLPVSTELAEVYHEMAKLHMALGDRDQALQFFQESSSLYRDLGGGRPLPEDNRQLRGLRTTAMV
ncbi:MAG: tetratricopeptide repeat protein [Bacillota bacterium]